MLLVGAVKACKAETEYDRFERNFMCMMVDMDWGHHSKNNRELLSVALWAGSGRSYRTASYAACIGVMETHYTRNREGKTTTRLAVLRNDNGTLIAEAKRIGLDGAGNLSFLYGQTLDRRRGLVPLVGHTYSEFTDFQRFRYRNGWPAIRKKTGIGEAQAAR
jgi:hypothetical protein